MQTQTRNAEFKALISLQNSMVLKAMGCQFDRGLSGGICVTLAGTGIGCWWYENGDYNFARTAHQVPIMRTDTFDKIISQTAAFAHAHFVRSQSLVM